jgi:EAL domain-containing protein (putative c-di-GMP-specific phosphodiesterase class I)
VVRKKEQDWTFDGEQMAPASFEANARALTPGDMNVVFQPIVELASGGVFGVEALARCLKPALKDPVILFKQAEKDQAVGYVGRLIRDVLFERIEGRTVFINLHPGELSSRWLVRPDDPMNFHDAPLYLEITETAAFQYFDLCKGALAEICARTGAHLVIDDFGAGYSNLKRVIDLHPSIVKLDRQLVTGIDRDRRQQELVRYVVQLCDGLGARVVAEGIETVDELKAIRDTGAHFGQGYLMARPGYPIPEVSWPLTADGRRRSQNPRRRSSQSPRAKRPSSKPGLDVSPDDVDLPATKPRRSATPGRRRTKRPLPHKR